MTKPLLQGSERAMLQAKLNAACRERDEAYTERAVLVGEVEALRERLGDRDQDVKILQKAQDEAEVDRDRYRESLERIARVCGWASSDGEFAVQIAREALDG